MPAQPATRAAHLQRASTSVASMPSQKITSRPGEELLVESEQFALSSPDQGLVLNEAHGGLSDTP